MVAETSTKSFARKLSESVTRNSDTRLKLFRANRKVLIESFARTALTPLVAEAKTYEPLNLLGMLKVILFAAIYMDPKPQVTTKTLLLRPFAERLRLAIEFLLEEGDAPRAYRAALTDAIFGWGIVMTTLGPSESTGGLIEPTGYLDDPGRPRVKHIHEKNFIQDMSVDEEDAVAYRGHRFVVPFEWAMDVGLYGKGELERLHKIQVARNEKRGAIGPDDESEVYERGEAFVEQIELATLWLPKHDVMVTLPGNMDDCRNKFLREDEAYGHERGPYTILSFDEVPGSIKPISPTEIVYTLSKLINGLTATVRDQAQQAKTFTVVRPGDTKLAGAVERVQNGGTIYGDPTNVKEVTIGGSDPRLKEDVAWYYDWFNRLSGNPNLLGGTDAASNTLGQDQMLYQSAGISLGPKRSRYQAFIKGSLEKLAWYLWNDKGELGGMRMSLIQDLGAGVELPIEWTPDEREGDWQDYNFDISSYTAAGQSPEERYARRKELVQNVVIPLIPLAQQQGLQFNVAKCVEELGRNLEIEEIGEWFTEAAPAPMEQAQVQQGDQEGDTTNISMGRPSRKPFEPAQSQEAPAP